MDRINKNNQAVLKYKSIQTVNFVITYMYSIDGTINKQDLVNILLKRR